MKNVNRVGIAGVLVVAAAPRAPAFAQVDFLASGRR
jgi:hypothetical protein